MNEELLTKISLTSWQYYLSRPFDLFQTSVWNRWYDSPEIQSLLEVRLTKGLFAEYPSKRMIRHYREDAAMTAMYASMRTIAETNIELTETFLDRGIKENSIVKQLISEKTELELTEALTLCIKTALVGTVFPYFAGETIMEKYGETSLLAKKAVDLRAVSSYPQIISELLIPAAKRELVKRSISPDLLPYILIDELQEGMVLAEIESRQELAEAGQYFLYLSNGSSKTVLYTSETGDYLKRLDPDLFEQTTEVKGVVGNPGRAKGRVRLVASNDLTNLTFNDGEILVAASTNPALVPIMKRAAAIVTDEGGTLCHAAIISRELNIPCVVGTKNATRMLNDGDMVEVDAESGIVRLLK